MIRKTDAIVLNTRKFGDSSLITSMYTRMYGRQNFIVKGYRSTRGKKRHSYFQPMSIIELVFYYKETRDLQLVSESSSRYFFRTLQTDPVRITLGMVVIEVFYQSVKEEERNEPLFEFLQAVLIALDSMEDRLINVFIWYLVHLTRFLGFFPHTDLRHPGGPVLFDLVAGTLESAPAMRDSDHLIVEFCNVKLENCREIRFGNAEKSELVTTLLQYYMIHVEGFREPESLKVLQEVFRD